MDAELLAARLAATEEALLRMDQRLDAFEETGRLAQEQLLTREHLEEALGSLRTEMSLSQQQSESERQIAEAEARAAEAEAVAAIAEETVTLLEAEQADATDEEVTVEEVEVEEVEAEPTPSSDQTASPSRKTTDLQTSFGLQ